MAAKVIQTRRQPAVWSVKADDQHRAFFIGEHGRLQAEAYAARYFGDYEVVEKPRVDVEAQWARMLAKLRQGAD